MLPEKKFDSYSSQRRSSTSIPVFLMFASLSRGSSRIRQSYICSSCLSNLARSTPQLSLYPGDHTCRTIAAPFSTTSASSQGKQEQSGKDAAESVESLDSKSSKPCQKHEPSRPLSKSKTTLAALRRSLLGEEEATSKNGNPKASEL